MTDTGMTEIVGYGMAGEQSAHEAGKLRLVRAQKKVEMIRHQRPGKTVCAGLLKEFCSRVTNDNRSSSSSGISLFSIPLTITCCRMPGMSMRAERGIGRK